jgi:hypothetical protein
MFKGHYLLFVNVGMVFANRLLRRTTGAERGGPMDPKLTMLFMLIGVIVGLSHVSERRAAERQPVSRIWRRFVPAWRRG